jgi:hypothetical protein
MISTMLSMPQIRISVLPLTRCIHGRPCSDESVPDMSLTDPELLKFSSNFWMANLGLI